LHIVVKKIRIWHVNRFFAVKLCQNFWRTRDLIRNDVIDVVGAGGSAKTHELNLNWRRPEREDVLSSAGGPAVEVEEQLNVLFINELCQFYGADSGWNLMKFVTICLNILSPLAVVVRTKTEADDVEVLAVI